MRGHIGDTAGGEWSGTLAEFGGHDVAERGVVLSAPRRVGSEGSTSTYRRDRVGVIQHSVWIQAEPDGVWCLYVDPSRIADWQTGSPVVENITGPGDEPGTTYVSRRSPRAAYTTVVEADRPRRLKTETEAYFGLRFDVVSRLEAERGGTRLKLDTETHWPRGMRLIGKLVELAILNRMEGTKELANLKALVEREANGSAQS